MNAATFRSKARVFFTCSAPSPFTSAGCRYQTSPSARRCFSATNKVRQDDANNANNAPAPRRDKITIKPTSRFSEDENEAFLRYRKQYHDDWKLIAAAMGNVRTEWTLATKARKQDAYAREGKVPAKRVVWGPREIAELERLYEIHGNNGRLIAAEMGGGFTRRGVLRKYNKLEVERAVRERKTIKIDGRLLRDLPSRTKDWACEDLHRMRNFVERHGSTHGIDGGNDDGVRKDFPHLSSAEICELYGWVVANSAIRQGPFTPNEDAIILAFVAKYSFDWATLHQARLLIGRNVTAIKSRMLSIMAAEYPIIYTTYMQKTTRQEKTRFRMSILPSTRSVPAAP